MNRVFRNKQGGLVVDYIGIANDLNQTLKEYTASNGRGRPTVDAHEAYAVLEEKLDVLRACCMASITAASWRRAIACWPRPPITS